MNGLRLRSNSTTSLAYKNLTQTQFSLNNTLQRLSSGLRINKAADDSANSTISTRMNNHIQGMKQANENVQQANNLIQTAENSLNDISDMLSRMRELAVQAATDTLNDTDRTSINLEYQTLKNEITRLANVTEYNEMDILNGTYYRNQVDADISTADDVSGSSIQALDDVIKGAYSLQDMLATDSNGDLIDANVTDTAGNGDISWISADGDVAAGDYRLMLSNGVIKLEKTSDGGTTWVSASSDTISADSVSQNSTFTFQTTNGKDVTVTFPDNDSDGVLDFKDAYPDNAGKIKDLPTAFSGLSSNLKLWLDSREWSAIETDGTNDSNWIDFSGKANHIGQSTTSETLNAATMIVVTKAGNLTPIDSSAGGIQLSDSSVYDEVLVFDKVLTGTEKTQINDYLTNKWGLGTSASGIITFTNAGATGRLGPTQSQIDSTYAGTDLAGEVTINTQGIQEWTVPATGTYTIEAWGAAGGKQKYSPGYPGGTGVKIKVEKTLDASTPLSILVGQKGEDTRITHEDNAAPGGGGGTFVWETNNTTEPIIAAGGGGGGGRSGSSNVNATTAIDGHPANGLNNGGVNGNGGRSNTGGSSYWAGGGAGWKSNGTGGNNPTNYDHTSLGNYNGSPLYGEAEGGSSPSDGGEGGIRSHDGYDEGGDGGFGGGGGGGSDNMGVGGGGGYSGGGGGNNNAPGNNRGGGGGSYPSTATFLGNNDGHGFVKISYDATSPGTYSDTVDPIPDQILGNFTVSSNRTLSLTGAYGNSQNLDYVLGNQETLSFSKFGIQVGLANAYNPSNGLDGKGVEITASRDLQVGADNDINNHLQLGISNVTANGLRIDGSQVTDIDQARAAITSLDYATDMVNQERSYLGSMQNRLAFTMSNLTSQTQSIESARSSIQDTDFAADAADLAKNQILAQSATAMLAQASAIPQNILSLIAA